MNVSQKFMRCVALVALMFGHQMARSQVDCTGAVTNLSLQLNAQGTVTLSLSGGPSMTYLCDIDGVGRNGVAPAVCRAMYASLLTAKTSGKKVLIRFYDYPTCAAVPAWGSAGALGWTQIALD
ncbi:hypothetical protein [Ideonella paludis]|uniref:Integron n=1 Tax=Ideonella paludis TaxID=1233411 RepID=A0ABS5DVC6_9BURK|nr:hypothetical protein [Ideonella paludis]MBQ0935111.1 hypothetical protein [Ideonella paludis]